jgi:hypothetical protein
MKTFAAEHHISRRCEMSAPRGSRMSIIKNLAGLSFVAMALAMSLPVDARIAGNTHEANRLAGNRLASNALTTNELAGDGAFTDIVAIDLPSGMRFTR